MDLGTELVWQHQGCANTTVTFNTNGTFTLPLPCTTFTSTIYGGGTAAAGQILVIGKGGGGGGSNYVIGTNSTVITNTFSPSTYGLGASAPYTGGASGGNGFVSITYS
jgi:hypothetical protein